VELSVSLKLSEKFSTFINTFKGELKSKFPENFILKVLVPDVTSLIDPRVADSTGMFTTFVKLVAFEGIYGKGSKEMNPLRIPPSAV
jgi:hypothetical protein